MYLEYDGSSYDAIHLGDQGRNTHFFLDSNCNLYTNQGVTVAVEDGVDNEQRIGDPAIRFFSADAIARSDPRDFLKPTCFVDSDVLSCVGSDPSLTVLYSCGRIAELFLGDSVPLGCEGLKVGVVDLGGDSPPPPPPGSSS